MRPNAILMNDPDPCRNTAQTAGGLLRHDQVLQGMAIPAAIKRDRVAEQVRSAIGFARCQTEGAMQPIRKRIAEITILTKCLGSRQALRDRAVRFHHVIERSVDVRRLRILLRVPGPQCPYLHGKLFDGVGLTLVRSVQLDPGAVLVSHVQSVDRLVRVDQNPVINVPLIRPHEITAHDRQPRPEQVFETVDSV